MVADSASVLSSAPGMSLVEETVLMLEFRFVGVNGPSLPIRRIMCDFLCEYVCVWFYERSSCCIEFMRGAAVVSNFTFPSAIIQVHQNLGISFLSRNSSSGTSRFC